MLTDIDQANAIVGFTGGGIGPHRNVEPARIGPVRGPDARTGSSGLTLTQDPKDAIEHATIIYAPNAARLVREHRSDGGSFVIAEFVAHDSRLKFRTLHHAPAWIINPARPVAGPLTL